MCAPSAQPTWRPRGRATAPSPTRPIRSSPRFHDDARRFDVVGFPAEHQLAWALAALDVLEEAGFQQVHEQACAQAETLAQKLADSGRDVAPRGHSTLVSWRAEDPAGLVAGLDESGFVLRDLPGTPYVRASVGAWNDQSDIDGLLSALGE